MVKILQGEITISDVSDGAPGLPGVGVSNIRQYYLLSNTPTGITRESSGWSTTPLTPTLNQRYLWIYTENTLSNGTKQYSEAYVSGVYGDKGVRGADGTTLYTWVKYADNKEGQNMSDSPEGKRFLGVAVNKPTATKSTNPADYTWSQMYSDVKISGMNMLREGWVINSNLSSYKHDDNTDLYEGVVDTAATSRSNRWGVRLDTDMVDKVISWYPDTSICYSAEIFVDKAGCVFNPDPNNTFKGSTSGNDHDEVTKRFYSPKLGEVLKENVWNKVYFTVIAKKIGYTELFDQGTFIGIQANNVEKPITFKIRRIMVSDGDVPSGYNRHILDVQSQIDLTLKVSDYKKDQDNTLTRISELEKEAKELAGQEPAWFMAYKERMDRVDALKQEISDDLVNVINDSFKRDGTASKWSEISEAVKNTFNDRIIWETNEGITIGDKSNNYISISERGIMMFAGNNEPAMIITPEEIQIPNGTFVKTNKVGHYQEEEYGTDASGNHVNVIRYIK